MDRMSHPTLAAYMLSAKHGGDMADPTGLYVINESFIRILRDDGGTTSIPKRLYEDCDYRPSVRLLPNFEEYRAEHGEVAT